MANPNWTPGVSGNPSGRPKENAEVKALAKQHTAAAIKALVDALGDSKSRVAAATALLDRAYGRPAQTLMGDADSPFEHVMRWAKEQETGGGT